MLGALLAALPETNPDDLSDAITEAEDNHWANDKNRFEDWLLNGETTETNPPEMEFYY